MNPETTVKLIVMVCEAALERSGGLGPEARVASRILAQVTAEVPGGDPPDRGPTGGRSRAFPRGRLMAAGAGGGLPADPDDNRPWLEALLLEARGGQ